MLNEAKEEYRKLEESFVEDLQTLRQSRRTLDKVLKGEDPILEEMEENDSAEYEKELQLRKLETLLEYQAIENQVHRYREILSNANGKSFLSGMKSVREVMMQWNTELEEIISKKLEEKNPEEPWVIIVKKVGVQKAIIKGLNYIINKSVVSYGDGTVDVLRDSIGTSVISEYKSLHIKKKDPGYYKRANALVPNSAIHRFFNQLFDDEDPFLVTKINPSVMEKIGNFFINGILENCKIRESLDDENSPLVPAFISEARYSKSVRTFVINAHENVYKLINDGHSAREAGGARLYPMVIKPLPWISPFEGPYLHYKVPILRANGNKSQITSLLKSDLSQIYRALNVLGNTPWVINKKAYDIINEAWEAGGDIADMPRKINYEYPPLPEDVLTSLSSRKKHFLLEKKISKLNKDLHSLRSDCKYKLEVAEKFLDHTIYFPHNLDFRGRSYPIPPHLNHLGSDLCRSLLKFEKSKPLGKRGLDWLKIQISNLYGVDKVSHADRIKFTTENIENIMDSADNPLKGKRWWLNADYPWQALAACIELTEALRSPNPEEFCSNLPIHQDGTCNGLQHYAALGGDELGAIKVNLIPSDKPQDVYTGVAGLVAEIVEKEAEEGNKFAIFFRGRIDRKLVKQTVMTSVYGVTYIGAREQIHSSLKEKLDEETNPLEIDDEFMFSASSYITKHTFRALNNMFFGARSIMAWLSECAVLIAKSGHPVNWITPLGLPVVQPYRKTSKNSVKILEGEFLLINDTDKLQVNTLKQKSAFPPNFIHSLDSTHMFLTALACDDAGITYSSVHDSFWTHACDVDKMNVLIRDQFIELHQQPLLQRLLEWFKTKHPTIDFPKIPEKGNLDLTQVKNSKYFFH
ncbi:hypothetical protein DICPUDRAFT_95344 [Dictyostelium purpureum]|uniref:DNA-directed RNA polymerase n=1 Tax=Dictyostelium purpureum TaxID=5786 RepID=F0ZVB9_DICPU|nr:uncharacterized protein DICPUDRAFT_95344 [Dictyostelium purpureum]EGC32106.1 hypothetical protein DICPUDRAFT_95344 [Dictyostelium purpureum]|eukprot:XP_003291356.1 hypothetical protein DICPUDRAFT_95344 [Dictyostelium purpureum]